jgi:NAD-dependent dihydropyrimidine dehydrogenase PreA subunit
LVKLLQEQMQILAIFSLPFPTKSVFLHPLLTSKKRNKMAYKITDSCAACGTCISECPVGAISEGDIYKIDPDTCASCGTCADVCPTGAIVEA